MDDSSDDDPPRRATPRPGTLRVDDDLLERIRALEKVADRYRVDRAVLLGHEGTPGRLGVLESNVSGANSRISALEQWRTALTAKISVGIVIGTCVAGVLTSLLTKWITT